MPSLVDNWQDWGDRRFSLPLMKKVVAWIDSPVASASRSHRLFCSGVWHGSTRLPLQENAEFAVEYSPSPGHSGVDFWCVCRHGHV